MATCVGRATMKNSAIPSSRHPVISSRHRTEGMVWDGVYGKEACANITSTPHSSYQRTDAHAEMSTQGMLRPPTPRNRQHEHSMRGVGYDERPPQAWASTRHTFLFPPPRPNIQYHNNNKHEEASTALSTPHPANQQQHLYQHQQDVNQVNGRNQGGTASSGRGTGKSQQRTNLPAA